MNIDYHKSSPGMEDALETYDRHQSMLLMDNPTVNSRDFAAGYNAAKAEVPLYNRIDHTNFVPGSQSHIWIDLVSKEYAQFYFTDETTDAHGPYLTEGEAIAQLALYVKHLG